MELKVENCIVCLKVFASDTFTAAEDVLNLFEFLVETINTRALQNAVICSDCLEKVRNAVNFQMSLLVKQENSNAETKQETDCDEKFVVCYICKNFTKIVSAKVLFNSCYENVVNNLIPKKDLDNVDKLQICDDCHKSLLNFQNIKLFLSVYDLNCPNNDQLNNDTVIDEKVFKIDIDDNCLAEDNVDMAKKLKQEIEEIKLEKDLQIKQELDLKMECKAGPSSSECWILNNEDQERSSTLSYPENDSDLTTSISKIGMDHKLSSTNLKKEKNKIDEIKMFKCSDCEFQTKYKRNLKMHEFIHKNGNEIKVFKCCNCEYRTKYKNDLKKHALTHKSIDQIEMFKCHICEFQTKQKHYLKQHALIHANMNEVNMYKCQNCEFETKHKYSLKHHAVNIHKVVINLFKCPTCNFQTKYKGSLKKHVIIHKNTNEVEMFKCHNCDYQTKYKRVLTQHAIIHKNFNEVEMFKCQNCQYQTKYKNSLKLHVLIHKGINEIEIFKCQICQYQTKRKDYLKNHLLIHNNTNGVEIFKCRNCKFQTKRKGSLKRHELAHKSIDEVKMFKCHNCEFQTKYKDSLKLHVLTHKDINEVEMLKCAICDFQTKQNHNLKRHALIHKNIK